MSNEQCIAHVMFTRGTKHYVNEWNRQTSDNFFLELKLAH